MISNPNEMPDDDASGDGDVEGVFGAELRNLETAIAGIYHFLMDTLHLVAKDNGVFLSRQRCEILKHSGAMGLFNRKNLITLCLQGFDCYQS